MVANSTQNEAVKELTKKLNKKPNNIFTLVKFVTKHEKDIEGGRRMRGKDGRLGFSEKKEKIMKKSYGGDH